LITHREGFTIGDFDKVLEGLLFASSAIILGLLVERERREHQARLEAERLAAIGKLVSQIAHDMKTPLMAIGGFCSQVARALNADDPIQKKLGVIIQETSRLESMVKEMLDFGRPLELQLSRRRLNEILLESMEVSKHAAKEAGVELEARLAPSLPEMSLDVGRMKQVFLNLIANAIQASLAGEKVQVRSTPGKNAVVVEVADSGCGISAEHGDSVFRPFFTTKKEGTGLGLAIVKKIVQAHRGGIRFQPNPDKGVTFIVSLPL